MKKESKNGALLSFFHVVDVAVLRKMARKLSRPANHFLVNSLGLDKRYV